MYPDLQSQIADYTMGLWHSHSRTRSAPSNWVSGNAVCCHYNGETADTRGRGGFIRNGDDVTYHCFNCGYKTGYTVGRPLSYTFRKLLLWLGASDNDVRRMVIDAIRVKDLVDLTRPVAETLVAEPVVYTPRPLPPDSQTFQEWIDMGYELPEEFTTALAYVATRNVDIDRYDFLWTPHHEHKLAYRVVIPFRWQGKTIGYTSRAVVDGIRPKFYTQHEPDYVFNVDRQQATSKFVLVVEGPFDAMSVDGVAVCGSQCSEHQADIIDSLGREVIVVPDFDHQVDDRGRTRWPGASLIDQALEYGWSVSFPVWAETCKDVNEAVVKYGKLFVLKTILDGVERSRLKIELRKKKYG